VQLIRLFKDYLIDIIQRFFSWLSNNFRKQGNLGKILIGFFILILLCCLCSIPLSISNFLSQNRGSPSGTLDLQGIQTMTSETTPVAFTHTAASASIPLDLSAFQTLAVATEFTNGTQAVFVNPTNIQTATLLPTAQQQFSEALLFHFIDVGQGDATLIQTPDGYNILIDGGDTNAGIISYLQNLGVNRIDLMIATHPHADHIGGLVQVLNSIPVTKVITNGEAHTTNVYENFLDAIINAQAEYAEVNRGDVIQVGIISFNVLNPGNTFSSDLNMSSLVLQFKYGQTTFLLMGDAGSDAEASILASGFPLNADVLKVAHHGSADASSASFLAAVHPGVAIYSAGIGNSYNLPSLHTINALNNIGAKIYGTDINGTIDFSVALNAYELATQRAAVPTTIPIPVVVPPVPLATTVYSSLDILSVTSPISQGAIAMLNAKTAPAANCAITVYYKSGPSVANGLENHTADANGNVSWSWKVGSRTTPGSWRIVVSCGGIVKETYFEVR
jgi:competence protein ComEC